MKMNIKLFNDYYLTNDERQFIIAKKDKQLKFYTDINHALNEAARMYLFECQDEIHNFDEYIVLKKKVNTELEKTKNKIQKMA